MTRRMLHAVWLVLAGSDCGGQPPQQTRAAEPEAVPEEMTVVATGPAAPDAGETPSSLPVAASPPPSPPRNARAVCESYRAHAKPPDPSTAQVVQAAGAKGGALDDEDGREGREGKGEAILASRAGPNTVRCSIVWRRSATTMDELVTPRCCPPRRGPCPQPYVQKVTGETVLSEEVILTDEGVRLGGRARLTTRNPHPTVMPYCGRRPEGFELPFEAARSTLSPGELLSKMAALETASIAAFARLEQELITHGAPKRLVRMARTARADEVRHARTMRTLAKSFGAKPSRTRGPRARLPCRDLRAIAHENVVEGCVNETYGALVATFQGERAETPALRRVFRGIARDERRHAALASNVHAWILKKLPSERSALEAKRQAALRELFSSIARQGEVDVAHGVLGLPSRGDAERLSLAYFGVTAARNKA